MNQALTPGTTTQNGLVAESDFQYEAPSNEPGFDLRSAEKSFIDQLLAGDEPQRVPEAKDEFSYVEEDEAPIEEAPGEIRAEDEPEVKQAEVAADDGEDDEDPKLARGIQRVVAREMAAKAAEAKAAEAKAAAEAKIAELRSLQGLKSTKEIADMMDLDPIGAFKAMGKDPDTMLKLALAQQLGDAAPESLKAFARGAGEKREIAQIRAELAAERQARAAQEYFNTISAGAREYVTKNVGDSKALPTLSKAAKVDSQYVHDEIMEEIVKEARVRAATDPDGEPLTYDEAAKRVESRLARIARLISVQSTNNPAAKNAQRPNPVPPTTKPAAKPLAPWQQRQSSLEEDGLKAALAEYERAEAARKAARR
jgi:hypothetical protein